MTGKRLTKEEIKSIQDDWLSGKSIVKLSKKYGRDKSTISKRVLKDVRHKRDPDLIRRVNELNDFAFDEINDKTLFWIGFIFADGNIHQDKRSKTYAPKITLTVNIKDKEIIKKFCDFISFDGKLREGVNNKGVHFVSIAFVSRKISKVLSHYGATPRKSKTLKPKNGIHENKYFWIGYICGDGSLGAYKKRKGKYTSFSPSIRIVGSYDICEAFYDYCSKYVPESEARPRKHKSIYSIGYATRPAIVLMKLFFDGEVYGLTRKIKLAKEIIEKHSYRLDIARTRTHAEKKEIFRLYNVNRWSIRKIAKELEIERGIVSRALKEKKATIREDNQIPAFDVAQAKKIVKLYDKLKSMPKVRKELNKKWKVNIGVDAYYRAVKRLKPPS